MNCCRRRQFTQGQFRAYLKSVEMASRRIQKTAEAASTPFSSIGATPDARAGSNNFASPVALDAAAGFFLPRIGRREASKMAKSAIAKIRPDAELLDRMAGAGCACGCDLRQPLAN